MQHSLFQGGCALARPLPPARRTAPWVPDVVGPYRLPRSVKDRLTAALEPLRNRDACFALAVFLARYWSTPARLARAFPIDRRALAGHEQLGLTEHQVRGAIVALEKIGFLGREAPEAGSRYQRTAEGLHRRPILFRFAGEYAQDLAKANARAQAAGGTPASARRPAVAVQPLRLLPRLLTQRQSEARIPVLMGDQPRPLPLEPHSDLESALARWRRAIEGGETASR